MINHIFITQVSLSIVMIVFCIVMIATDNTSDTRSVYLPILTSIVGVWLPQPTMAIKDSPIHTPLIS